jgi:DNA-binding MarR family transcriptional regulator
MSRLPAADRGAEPAKIAGGRLSKLQKRILCWLDVEEKRTDRIFSSSHQQLVQTLPNAKGNISHSLRLLEAHGLVEIGRSPGGQAEYVRLTSEGCQKALKLQEVMIKE